jgi:Tfp pilus assembly protein PilN
MDSDAVAEFMRRLQMSNMFYEVKLLKTELKEVGKKNLQNFQIRCMKNAPPKPAPTAKKGKKKK